MNRSTHRQLLRGLAILGLLLSGQLVTHAHALPEPLSMTPQLSVTVADPDRGLVLVTGQDFTPGGRVFLDVYDDEGLRLIETRWARASEESFGLNGSRDPALGYVPGGEVFEMFAVAEAVYGPNGSRDPAQGYRPGLLGGADADAVVSGPNGSRDPALIGVPGNIATEQRASTCGPTLVVQALDEQAAAWSNMLHLDEGCRTAATAS